MVGGSICVYSSRSLQICPLINRDHSGSCGSMSEYESRGPVSALLRGARCGPGGPAPPQRVHRRQSRALSVTSRAGVSLKMYRGGGCMWHVHVHVTCTCACACAVRINNFVPTGPY